MDNIKVKKIEAAKKKLEEFSASESDSRNKVSLVTAACLLEQISDTLKKN